MLSSLAFPLQNIKAQDCEFLLASCPWPASLGICDLGFRTSLRLEHLYPTDHTFTVVVNYGPDGLDLTNPNILDGFDITTDANGNIVVTGTFTVPFNPAAEDNASIATKTFIFDRIGTWPGVDQLLTISIFDADCGTAEVAFFNTPINIFPQFTDLRSAASNLASVLQADGTLTTCGSGFVDNILIGTELIVDSGVDLCFFGGGGGGLNSSIAFLPGAKIVVKDGASLTLNRVNVFTCDDQLAKGIEVESGGKLIIDTSMLSDARFAVQGMPGASLSISRTSFFDNYIGLHLDMSSATEANKRVALPIFNSNRFSTVNSAIKFPYSGMPEPVESRGYCGILLHDYRDFNIFGTNSFSALANGIIVRRSTLNLGGNMSFDDMNSVGTSVYPLEGFGIHLNGRGNRPYWAHINEMWWTMTFNNCKTGIFGTYYSAQVDNVQMTNVITGIDWTQSRMGELRMRSNNITASRYGIRSYHNEPVRANSAISDNVIVVSTAGGGLTPVTGIEMQEPGLGANLSGGWPVSGNDVTMNVGGRGILYRNGVAGVLDGNSVTNLSMPNSYTGIFTEGNIYTNVARNTVTQSSSIGLGAATGIFSAAGTANTYQCNCLDNTHVGAQFYDLADFTNAVRGNNFNTHTTGLQLGNAGVGDVFIGRQTHMGNLWDLAEIPSGEFGGINWGVGSTIIQSRFAVPGSAGSNAEHPDVDPVAGWFVSNTGTSFTCSSGCSFPTSGGVPPRVAETGVPTTMDYDLVNGNLSNNVDMAWKGDYRLYRKLLRQPAIAVYDTVFASFLTAHATLPAGKLAYIAEERAKLFALDSLDQITDADYRSDIALQIVSLRIQDSLVQAAVAIDTAAYSTLVSQKATNEASYAAFLEDIDSLRQLKIATLLTLNSGVGTSTVCVANHGLVNNILLNMLANGDDAPSPTNLGILAAIAEMCPIEGGDAVYEARAIVERLTGETYDDAVLCAVEEERPSNGRDSDALINGTAIVLYPNPTTGLLQWSGTTGEMVTVRVFDQLGVLAKAQNVNGVQLDLGELPNGLYFVQITGADGALLATQKITLLKH